MSVEQLWVIGIAALLLFWALGAHNRVVALRSAIAAAWAQVDASLQRRAAAIAALVTGLRGHMPDEQGTLDAVLVAQGKVQAAADALRPRPAHVDRAQALMQAEGTLSAALARLLALLDHQPALRLDSELAPPLAVLHDTAPRLAFARQVFNDAARVYNDASRQFPTRLLVRLFGFAPAGEL
jgi:LemA protein